MKIILQPSTKTELDDISVTNIRCYEFSALYIKQRVQWVEQGSLLAVKYISLYTTKKLKGRFLQCKALSNKTSLILVFFPSFTTVNRSVLLMTTMQPTQV